jgi:hypothetical protein
MDTDDLSEMAYEIIGLAGEASGCLRAEIGAMCSRYLAHVRRIEKAPQNYIEDWDLPEDEESNLADTVRALREHIEKTIAVPLVERGKPEF